MSDAPRPARFDVHQDESALVIEWRWRSPLSVFLLFFTAAWWAALLVFLATPLAPFLALHIAAGLIVAWAAAAFWLNTTHIEVSAAAMHVEHTPVPVPWRPGRRLERHRVARLWVRHNEHISDEGTVTVTWELLARGLDGRDAAVVGGLRRDEARYLEQTLSRFWSLDAPTPP